MGSVTGGRLIVDALKREGVEYIFSLAGGHIDAMYQACLDTGIKVIDTRHEQAAAHMAEAWGRLTRMPGICAATAGPGFTNAITGVANAAAAGSPMILIAGKAAVPSTETLPMQELDQIDIIRPLVKWARVVYEPRRLGDFVAMAYRHAMTGRPGPVFLEVPIDVMNARVDENKVSRRGGYRPDHRPGGSKEGLARALDLLRNAKRPVAIAGSGAYYADAGDILETFCERFSIPLFTKLSYSRGVVPDDAPCCAGGMVPGALAVMPDSDVVLVLGARLDWAMLYGQPPLIPQDAALIQVDIEGSEIGRNRKVDLGIVGDIKEVLEGMLDISGEDASSRQEWLASSVSKSRDSRKQFFQDLLADQEDEPIHPARLMMEINDYVERDAIVVADGGDTAYWTMFVMEAYQPGHLLYTGSFGCLGVGIPFGLAAKLRHPEKQVLVTMGDGSAGINLMEFHTAVRFGLPIVMVICNDCSWGMIRHGQVAAYGTDRSVGCELGEVPYEKMVESLGGYGECVTSANEIRPALERAFASGKPACVNVYVDRDIKSDLGAMIEGLG